MLHNRATALTRDQNETRSCQAWLADAGQTTAAKHDAKPAEQLNVLNAQLADTGFIQDLKRFPDFSELLVNSL